MDATVTYRGQHPPYPSPPVGRHQHPQVDATRPRPAGPVPPGSPWQNADEALAAELRIQVVDRLRFMNTRHAQHAWDRQDSDPLAPHGLAFFYADTNNNVSGRFPWRVRTATRLYLDGPEVGQLAWLLYEQARIADGYWKTGELDPRTQLANRVEPMTPQARYLGVGVSTLDVPGRPWQQQRHASNTLDVGGRCFALLVDGSWLLQDRGGPGQYGAQRVWSTHSLAVTAGQGLPWWRWGHHLPELEDPDTADIWRWLHHLHDLIQGADCDR